MWYVTASDHSQTLVHSMVFYVLGSEPIGLMKIFQDFCKC
jgi:hypothetical protein